MAEISAELGQAIDSPSSEGRRAGWLAAGGVIGAILASACCVGPLLLVTLGVSGAWIGRLTASEPYKPYVAAVTLGLIGAGFWYVYGRAKPVCVDGHCARPASSRFTKSALWAGTVIVLLAITINWWAPFLY